MTADQCIVARILHKDPLLSAGLCAILNACPGIAATADASGDDCIDCSGEQGVVDVLVADYEQGLHRAGQFQASPATRAMRQPRILIVTPRECECEIRAALQAGIHGYMILGCDAHEITSAARAVAQGVKYLCPLSTQRIAESLSYAALTTRESEVLGLLADGLSNKLIARDLCLSTGTVKSHIRAILSKLDAVSRTQAVLLATQRGLVKALNGRYELAGASSAVAYPGRLPRREANSKALIGAISDRYPSDGLTSPTYADLLNGARHSSSAH